MDAFDCRLGHGQGRMEGGGFVLGGEDRRLFHELSPGDHAELVQQVDLTDADLVRMEGTIEVPEGGPAWEVSVIVDGVKGTTRTVDAGGTRRLTDLCANVSKLTGVHEVGVRLEML